MTMMLDRRALIGLAAASALFPRTAFAQTIPAPDREEMVPVEGGRIYVRVNGRIAPDRPPLLMVHGGPGSSHAGFLPALALARDRAIILYDQLDSGRSERPMDPRNWRVGRFVDEVDAIRRALDLTRLHLYGGSWGGTIALEYAARRPRGLASAILQSPLVSTRSWLADANALRRTLPTSTQAMLDRCERPRPPSPQQCSAAEAVFNERYLRGVPRTREVQAYLDALPMPFNQRVYETMWGRTEFVSTGTLRTYNGEPLLARLDGPRTFFVTGQHDEARPATVAGFAARVPGSEFAVIPGAAHGIFNDNPEPLLFLLARWMRRHDAA
jgi:proline iminopeptidase/L-proline amide hydrolase